MRTWGSGLGLRNPRSLAAEAGVAAGSNAELSFRRGELIVKPASRRTYRLKDLLSGVTRDNAQAAIDTGGPAGTEIW